MERPVLSKFYRLKAFQELARRLLGKPAERTLAYVSTANPKKQRRQCLKGEEYNIGILGGAFDPAHDGHLYISKQALTLLNLDQVWWLVSHQHPTKLHLNSDDFNQRLKQATECASVEPNIHVSDFERQVHSSYTIDTVKQLHTHFPKHQFTWLMGSDNFTELHHWRQWQELLNHVNIAVFNRTSDTSDVLQCPAAVYFKDNYTQDATKLTSQPNGLWSFLNIPLHPASSSALRAKKH